MNLETFKATYGSVKKRASYRHEEDDLQATCVELCRRCYPDLLIFAIPNGGKRGKREAARLKKAGVLAGVADLFIAESIWKSLIKLKHGLFLEAKSADGEWQASQKAFKAAVKQRGYAYEIFRSSNEFLKILEDYFGPRQF